MLNNLTVYDLLNGLVPGTLFAFSVGQTTAIELVSDQQLIALVLFFGYGLVLSRLGSILLEPLYLKTAIIARPVSYEDFIDACASDEKIDRLVEISNMYRTICSAILTFAAVYLAFGEHSRFSEMWFKILAISLSLLVLFSLSWRKQELYIYQRVKKVTE